MTLTSGFSSRNISSILFEAGIQNLVYGYILGLMSVMFCSKVIMILTSTLLLEKIIKMVCPALSNNFAQMCCMLDPLLWEHLSCY